MEKTRALFKRPFTVIRSFSTSVPSSTAATSVAKKFKCRMKKNLFEVAQFLPNWGIGYQMAKNHWTGVSYQITKINLYKDGRHGKAWGVVYKNGLQCRHSICRCSQENKWGSQALLEVHSS
uniref:28S ribosomal protein S34, mitochondrial n=1 Tax=Nelumbo nucifera TaxID=4432 RepID=A0A822XJ04_NELNU|nr:TPA_asm: hypothetical protein HUJ06_021445 [Nelumbo nucifera]